MFNNREDFVKLPSVKAIKKAMKAANKKAMEDAKNNEIKQSLYKVNEDDNNKYEFVGEGGCTNNINKVIKKCADNINCDYIGEQSNGCWHLLKKDPNGSKTVSSYSDGLYGLNIKLINDNEKYKFVGEGKCNNDINKITRDCEEDVNCYYIGQQSNGCWHKLQRDPNGTSKVSSYPKGFYGIKNKIALKGWKVDNDDYLYNIIDNKYIFPCFNNNEPIKKSDNFIDNRKIYDCKCDTWDQQKNENGEYYNPRNHCYNNYKKYNLFPTDNNFVVKGKNLDQNFKNELVDKKYLSNLSNSYNSVFTNVSTDLGIMNDINKVLEKGPLKLACCNSKDNPISYNYNVPLDPNNSEINTKEFKFQRENIKIPPNSCPTNYNKYNSNCNAFMNIYCDNMYKEFKKLNLLENEFSKYSQECACYVPRTDGQKLYPQGAPSKCFKEKCVDNTQSYLDPSSQNTQCSFTMCQNIVNAADISAGGDATLTPNLINNCGNAIDKKINLQDNQQNNQQGNQQDNSLNDNQVKSSNITSGSDNKINSESEKSSNNLSYIITGIIICFCCLIVLFIFFSIQK